MRLIAVESRKDDKFTFRMPVGLVSMESVWQKIIQVCDEYHVGYVKAGLHATLEEFDDVLGDIEWLWYQWIPKGFVSMIVGDPGTGKSAIMLDVVKRVTNNLPFPLVDKPFGKKGVVVWIDTEATQQILNLRSKAMLVDRRRVHIPVIDGDLLSQPNITSLDHQEQIINLVEAVHPDMIVLDSLGGSHSRGENKTEDIKPVMEFFALLSRDQNTATTIVHHLNKGHSQESPEVSLYRIRGSTIIPALARSIMALERSADGNTKLRIIKSNLAAFSEETVINVIPELTRDGDILGFDYKPYQPPPAKRNKKEKCADWIVEQLQAGTEEGVELTQLIENGEAIGYTRGNIYAARDVLGDRITFGGTGRKAYWKLTVVNNDSNSIESLKKGLRNGSKK